VRRHPALAEAPLVQAALVAALSGRPAPDAATRARTRGALGAISAVVLRAEPDEDPALLRSAAVLAGCGVLGIPSPRHL